MGTIPLPSKEQISEFISGSNKYSENYIHDLISVCHAILVEIQEEQRLREQHPELKAIYNQYRQMLNDINTPVNED